MEKIGVRLLQIKFRKSADMDNSECLQPVVLDHLICKQAWSGTNSIEDKVSGKVVPGNGFDLFVSMGLLQLKLGDLDEVDDINNELDVVESWIQLV